MLNSAEHEIFSANKYENADNSCHFHIYQQRNFHAYLCLARQNLELFVTWDLLAGPISCSAELSMTQMSWGQGKQKGASEHSRAAQVSISKYVLTNIVLCGPLTGNLATAEYIMLQYTP